MTAPPRPMSMTTPKLAPPEPPASATRSEQKLRIDASAYVPVKTANQSHSCPSFPANTSGRKALHWPSAIIASR